MTTQKQSEGLARKLPDVPSRDAKGGRSRPVVLGKVSLLLTYRVARNS